MSAATIGRQLVRDLIKGATGLGVNLTALYLLVDVVGVEETTAPLITITALSVSGYFITDWWTFAEVESASTFTGHLRRGLGYVVARFAGQGVKYIVYLLILTVGVPYLVSWAAASGAGFAFSFVISYFVWSGTRPAKRLFRWLLTQKAHLTADRFERGAYSYLNLGCKVRGEVSIGRYCAIGQDVRFLARDHRSDLPCQQAIFYSAVLGDEQPYEAAPIDIGHDVWIGDGATITKGVEVGHGAIVATGAVVTDDVAPYEIVGGVPAEHIGWRFSEEKRRELLAAEWWEWSPDRIRREAGFFGGEAA